MDKVIRMWDEYGQPKKLVGVSDWLPSPKNRDPFNVKIPSVWLAAQTCPEHPDARDWVSGKGFSAVRTKFKRMPWNVRLWGVAVQFVCPFNQHVWESYFRT